MSEPEDVLPPAAFLMLDRSLSMGSTKNDLWVDSVNAIDQAVAVLEADLYFGLGMFPPPYGDEYEGHLASYDHIFSLGAHQAIMDILSPMGDDDLIWGTSTADAGRVITSVVGDRVDLTGAGMMITDGKPYGFYGEPRGANAREEVLRASCDARDAGVVQYVIGIGSGIDKDFNDIQAAALGTGSCTGGDPCNDTSNIGRTDCEGSYQVYDSAGLRDLLLQIGNEIACTFPIEDPAIAQWPSGVPDDPGAVLVNTYRTDSATAVPIDHQSVSGSGWFFATSSRTHVTRTPDLCAEVGSGVIEQVGTQAACDCGAIIEANPYCLVPNTVNAACPAKEFVCNGNIPECTGPSIPQGNDCPWQNCPPLDTSELCHVDNDALVKVSGSGASWNGSVGPGDIATERNRCKLGVLTCNAATGAECLPFSPMPELCNGLDNNCDDLIDNTSTGWAQVTDASYPHDDSHIPLMSIPPDAEYPGAACYEEDFCGCPDGQRGEHGGLQAVLDGTGLDAEFAEYLGDWLPADLGGCGCMPSLSR